MTTALEGVRGQRHAPAALYPGKYPVPFVQEAGWSPGPVWTGSENLAYTGIRSPDCPARSQSLYRLRYPAHELTKGTCYFICGVFRENYIVTYPVNNLLPCSNEPKVPYSEKN